MAESIAFYQRRILQLEDTLARIIELYTPATVAGELARRALYNEEDN